MGTCFEPLRDDATLRWAAGQLIKTFSATDHVHTLGALHAKIQAPVVLIWGVDDPFFPIELRREMVAGFPDARLYEIPDAKLFVHEERADLVAEAMLPTLLGTTNTPTRRNA